MSSPYPAITLSPTKQFFPVNMKPFIFISIRIFNLNTEKDETIWTKLDILSGGSKGGASDAPRVQILSISCSFGEISAKSYVGAPPGELAPPPRGNPGSATDTVSVRKYDGQVLAYIYIYCISMIMPLPPPERKQVKKTDGR